MTYRCGVDRHQEMLLAERVEDYVGADNPVRAIEAFIEGLDLPALGWPMRGAGALGTTPYDPRAMLKLFVYGYLNRLRSSRELEKATRRNLEVIWLMRKLTPDHWTINEFRRIHRARFKGVFRQFHLVCGSLGLFGAELVAVDGTFLKAVNNPQGNFTEAKVQGLLAQIDARCEVYLQELETLDAEAAGQSMAEATAGDRAVEAERLRAKLAAMEEQRARCQELLTAMEKSPTGQVSLNDADARSLEKGCQRTVGYNAQIAVDAAYHLIVAEEVTQEPNDVALLAPMAAAAKEALGVEQIKVVADRGYYSHEQMRRCAEQDIETYVPRPAPKQAGTGGYPLERFVYEAKEDLFRCPQNRLLTRHEDTRKGHLWYRVYYAGKAACRDCPVRAQCTKGRYRKLTVPVEEAIGAAVQARLRARPEIFAQRRNLVEHPFGTMKFWQGYHHLLTTGLESVRAEFTLSCLAYNFRRVLNLLDVGPLLVALAKIAAPNLRLLARVRRTLQDFSHPLQAHLRNLPRLSLLPSY
jgi:transposase